jgi:hypothetical protein
MPAPTPESSGITATLPQKAHPLLRSLRVTAP